MTGAELTANRRAAKLSQGELAKRAGISRHAVGYWDAKVIIRRGWTWPWAVERMGEVLNLPDEPRFNRRMPAQSFSERIDCEARVEALMEAARRREADRAARAQVICGAMTRKGAPCRCKSEPGKRRCKFHGGKSTGARTPEGLARIAEAQRRRWAKWRAARETGAAIE